MKISSGAFPDNGVIPAKYTCDGQDLIPPLTFSGVPAEARSLVLVVDDPDAPVGIWDHWVLWSIPPETREVEEGKSPSGITGRNSWGKNSWGGPCPPDREHRYFFKLYALDAALTLPPSAGKGDLEMAMKGHILAEAQLIGRYDRQSRVPRT
jgi:Raf kinase inhibitor-like YbhB/YbcL family protein